MDFLSRLCLLVERKTLYLSTRYSEFPLQRIARGRMWGLVPQLEARFDLVSFLAIFYNLKP